MERMEKPTAVEQFILDLQEHFPNHMNSMYNNNQLLLQQLTLKAKEMGKEQMINFAKDCMHKDDCFFIVEQYYNKIFKSE